MLKREQIKQLGLSEITDYIIKEYHLPIRIILPKIEKKIIDIEEKYNPNDISLVKEIFKQFIYEMMRHINREENIFFPTIIKVEKWILKDIEELEKYLNIQRIEHNEIETYLIWWETVIKKLCKGKEDELYVELKNLANELYDETVEHVYIENMILDKKVWELLESID